MEYRNDEDNKQFVGELKSPENLKNLEIGEVLRRCRHELAFQSYEQFNNDADQQKASFISGKSYNPSLDYPVFTQPDYLSTEVQNLSLAANQIAEIEPDEFKKDILNNTIQYRLAEIGFVQTLAKIDQLIKTGQSGAVADLAERARDLNEQLYGRPQPELVDAILNQIWNKINAKNLSDSAQTIYNELKNGFYFGQHFVAGLPVSKNPQARLPEFDDDPSLAWAGEYILDQNADLEALVRELWEQKVDEFGDDYVATSLEIKEFFENALRLRDPEGVSGVKVIFDADAEALSWNSAELAVVVGGKRSPIKNAEEMFTKVLHEFGVHGQRAINGFKTDLPILGSGLFTNTPRADYLTFEEGLATMLEASVKNEKTNWTPANMGLYLNVALAEAGHDFREVYELSWRYRVLFGLKDGEELTAERIDKQKNLAYKAAVRVFRGTPTDLASTNPEIRPLTYNKDLAYLNGRVDVINYFRQVWQDGDAAKLDELFIAKFDPTIPEQADIVRQFTK
ncbi:MAG: DUF1704 domain-containing protein [Candidatus Saccharibacteria bacterium]|nr:DUF1704 domain-containing protein [Candidatus Saccharibacteria bacterium]